MSKNKKIKATRLPADVTIDGVPARAGDWLVAHEDGATAVLSNDDFQRLYGSKNGHALVRRQETGVARRGKLRPVELAPGERGGRARGRGEENEIMRVADGLAGMVRNALSPGVFLPGLRVVDTETGEVVYERAHGIDVEAERRPTLTKLQVNEKGEVIGAEIKPEEWPPRRGASETF